MTRQRPGLGNIAPGVAPSLDAMAIYVNGASVVSIAIVLIFLMYPVMLKIAFAESRAGESRESEAGVLDVGPIGAYRIQSRAWKDFRGP